MSFQKVVTLLSCAAILSLCSCTNNSSASPAAKSSSDRKLAPDFTLTDANGGSVKLSDYRGKVVLLNFWATWCGPCTVEIPWFEEFEQQYRAKGLEVVGISMDEDGWKAIKPFITEHKVNYRILLGNDTVSQLYGGVESLPTTFIIDRSGKFAFSPHVGLATKDEYLSEIQDLVGGRDTHTASLGVVPALPGLFVAGAAK